jgi:predicted DNA-binding helix-hairpin-helix protein
VDALEISSDAALIDVTNKVASTPKQRTKNASLGSTAVADFGAERSSVRRMTTWRDPKSDRRTETNG